MGISNRPYPGTPLSYFSPQRIMAAARRTTPVDRRRRVPRAPRLQDQPQPPGFSLSSAHLSILASALIVFISLFNAVRGISRLETSVDVLIGSVADLRTAYATTTNTLSAIQTHLSVIDSKQTDTEKEVDDLKSRLTAVEQSRLEAAGGNTPRVH